MLVSEFDYALPEALIAQHPAAQRTASRLLRLDAASGAIEDLAFADLPALVDARDCLVLNDTRVIKARLSGRKDSGGRMELFIERLLGPREALALIRSSHPPKPGTQAFIEKIPVDVEGREEDLYRVRFAEDIESVLERFGAVPLPPYIAHAPLPEDTERYQTVYAGTFQPVRVAEVEAHRMHSERYEVSPQTMACLAGRRVLAVGTTSLRALESAAASGRLRGETDLFVYPGFRFRVVKRLLTNFHLPRSTLLMLVCAFGGKENVLRAYRHAVQKSYRFFSYGDAMLIET
jgi:S-adenosylmethionine:tRNA ribosyltransferase-isomerase